MKTNKTITKLVDSETIEESQRQQMMGDSAALRIATSVTPILLETELEFLTDRINTQLEMIENLQAKLEALENDLAEHHIKEMARDEFKQILEDGEVVVSLDHLIT